MAAPNSLVDTLLSVEPRQYVTLTGYPEQGATSRWHVNKALSIGAGDGARKAIVLQEGSGDAQWIVAVLVNTGSEWTFDTFAAFEGDLPDDLAATDHADPLDPEDISLTVAE